MIQINKNNIFFNISNESINIKWFIKNYQNWEPYSFKIIDELITDNMTVIDIGTWIGPILLYVAPKVKRIIGIECDPLSFESLQKNVNCNDFKDKVQLEYSALYNKNKKIYVGGGRRGANWGSSEITITDSKDIINKKVNGITIDYLVNKYNIIDCDFVKMDIEGGEAYVIESMRKFFNTQMPILYISIHPHLITYEQLKNTISDIFSIFPYVYDVNYKLLNEKETILNFLKNKIKIEYEGLASNVGHELVCSYYEIPLKKTIYKNNDTNKKITFFQKIINRILIFFKCILNKIKNRKNKCDLSGRIEIL